MKLILNVVLLLKSTFCPELQKNRNKDEDTVGFSLFLFHDFLILRIEKPSHVVLWDQKYSSLTKSSIH